MPPGAELLTHHAYVDLETTGLDPSADEVIEFGALFVERGTVVRRVSRLFRPRGPLPLAIRRLTGLTDAELAPQPAFAEFAPELRELLQGWTVVAHNAAFERGFLAELLESIGGEVLDSCELLHYLNPELESHSLEAAIRWAAVGERAAHRALKDCEDTFAVVCHALDRCIAEGRSDEVRDLLECLDAASAGKEEPRSPLVELLRRLYEVCRHQASPLSLAESSAFLPGKLEWRRAGPAPEPAGKDAEVAGVEAEEVDALLGPGGALKREVEGFTSRPGQVEMARAVAKTLSEGGVLAVEAGTGTGKSLAYLAPATLFAARNGRKVAVAPHTKTLQDQLVEKDLPRLHRAMGGAFQYAVLKGQNNYLCRRRALEATRVTPGMGHEERAPRAYLRAYLRRSLEGHLDRLSYWFKEHFPLLGPLALAARSEAATTLGERCPHFHQCFYHSAVAQAKAADLLVINQALALAWPQRYPRFEELILDEAHELEDVATSALAAELSDAALARIAARLLGGPARSGLLRQLRRALGGAKGKELSRKVKARAEALQRAAARVGEALAALCAAERAAEGGEPGFTRERRLDAAARATPEWKRTEGALGEVAEALRGLSRGLKADVAAACPELELEQPHLEREVAGVMAELEELGRLLDELMQDPLPSRCYAASVRAAPPGWSLTAQPVSVATYFREELLASKRALVLTSATLSTGVDRPWVLERLGLTGGEGRPAPVFLRAPSPFELERQALVVLVTDAPRPQDEAFIDWAAQRIGGLARFLGGRVLGLFASSWRLERVGEKVAAQLEPLGIEVMRQSRGHGRQMAAHQERDLGSVLLGTKSFWQGVDIPGRGVALVFIDKLPIEPHTRPIVAAREERWAGTGGGFAGFAHYRLPRALLLLRQGVGRLVRSPRDRGVVVIADPGSPHYREQVIAALAGYRVEALPWAQARVRIFHALLDMGLATRPPAKAATASGDHQPAMG